MLRPFGRDGQAIEHARQADREVADIDHLLHFAFAFGDNLAGLERDELAEVVLQFAQSVAELPNGFAAHRAGRDAPFQKSFLSAR